MSSTCTVHPVFIHILLWTTYFSLILSVDLPPRVTRPPTIMPEPRLKEIIYFEPEGTQSKDIPCRALGSNPKTFEWTKNGNLFDVKDPKYKSNTTGQSRIVRVDQNTGFLTFTEMKDDDEGIYQCVTKNKYGTSLSKKIQLKKATKRTFTNPNSEDIKRVPEAHPLKLECNPPENEPAGIIRWVKYSDGGEGKTYVEFNERIAKDGDGNLYFANIQHEDENNAEMYTCEIQIREFSLYIEGAITYIKVQDGINAQFPPDLVYSSNQHVVGLKGEKVTLQCIFSGNPTPIVTWEKGGKVIKKSKRFDLQFQKLVIRDVQYEDAGDYRCKGTNPVLQQPKSKTFKIAVQAKPEWVQEPKKVDAGVQETAVFNCSAAGNPTPTVHWYINGQPFQDLPKDTRRSLKNGQLTFTDLREDDAQVIQCNASNDHGYVWADVALSILAYKPEIKASFERIKISEDQNVLLPCEIDGKPKPQIYWKRGGQKAEGPRFDMNPTGNLTITKARQKDAGVWTCFAENIYGKFHSSGELLVREKTSIENPPQPNEQQKMFGSLVYYECGAVTDANERSNLKINWLKDEKPLVYAPPRIYKDASSNSLVINGTRAVDTGVYTCVASNGLDSDRKSATLDVAAPPNAPTNVTFDKCKSRSVQVSWKAGSPNFRPITKYFVEYRHSYPPYKWTRAPTVNNPSTTKTEVAISPHANYTFRVIAKNILGESAPSEMTQLPCQSGAEPPDKNPTNVHTDRSRPGWLIIKWDPMPEIEHNGEGFHYKLSIKKDGKLNTTDISDWTETVREMNMGLIYEPYEIYIEAVNNVGSSKDLAIVHIGYTGEAEPLTAPSNFELVPKRNVTAKTAEFQWDPVDKSPEVIRGEFKGYKIRYWKIGSANTSLKEIIIERKAPVDTRIKRALKEHAIVSNLPPYSKLEAYVVASNSFYDSNTSNVVQFETPEGVPGKPKIARVIRRGHDHFLIEWQEPTEPNGIITGYQIGFEKVEGFDVENLTIAATFNDTNIDRAVIDGLETSTNYIIHVAARTSKGVGVSYYFDAKTTVDGPLLTPEVEFPLIGEDFVNITWTVPSGSDNPAGSSHYVKYRKAGQDWETVEAEDTVHWLNISGLDSKTMYEMRVVATSSKGDAASKIEKVVTRGDAVPSESTEKSIAQATWFIVMMIAIAVLVLFIIIICFVKRSRGEKYNVQARELLRGTDPEHPDKHLFNDFPKSGETDPLAAGSPDSFDADGDKLPGGSETDSMAEYGDVDPSKFNEDGSFIGQYGNQKTDEKGNQPSAMSTFV